MELRNIRDMLMAKMETRRAAAAVASAFRAHPDLSAYETHHALLAALRERSLAMRPARSQVVRALLHHYQRRAHPICGELLFLAYYPMLLQLATEVREHMRNADADAPQELVLASFFQAAAKMPLDRNDAPTALNLALKTKQVALRELARRTYNFCGLESEWATEDAEAVPTFVTPEVAINARDALHALDGCKALLVKLLNSTCDDVATDDLCDPGSLHVQLRRRFPGLGEASFNRLYQRARQRRHRLAAEVRRRTKDSASQIRDYLDLLGQEDL